MKNKNLEKQEAVPREFMGLPSALSVRRSSWMVQFREMDIQGSTYV
jgi:hypothetical protein